MSNDTNARNLRAQRIVRGATAAFWAVANRARGLGWYMDNGVIESKPNTCPAPLHPDWSISGCIKRGDCGCVHGCGTPNAQVQGKTGHE